MFFYDGYTCPVCEQPFKETDDVVACPACGAPHHRACWQQEGHCHYADRHGTPDQWTKQEKATKAEPSAPENTVVCPNCGYRNPAFAEICAHCGRDLTPPETDSTAAPPEEPVFSPFSAGNCREYSPYHVASAAPCGDIPPEEDVAGVKAGDLAAVIGNNVPYYLPRFRHMHTTGATLSWNWAAFFLTSYWLLYRKNYRAGILCLLLENIIGGLSSFLMYTAVFPVTGDSLYSSAGYAALMNAMLNGTLTRPMTALFLLSVTSLIVRVLLGALGNTLYFRTCRRRVIRFRLQNPNSYPAELTALGGTAFVLGIIAYIFTQFVGYLLAMLL